VGDSWRPTYFVSLAFFLKSILISNYLTMLHAVIFFVCKIWHAAEKEEVNVTHTMDNFGEKVGPKWPGFEKNLFEVASFRK
jgi:hypothetical protein